MPAHDETHVLRLLDEIAQKQDDLHRLRGELSRYRDGVSLPSGALGVLLCRVAGVKIALRDDDVDEVVAMAELTVLPGSPPWFAGLLQVGPDRIPVVDVAARETGVRRELDPSELIVLAHTSGGRLGLIVDALDGLARIESSEVHRPSAELPFAAYVVGVVAVAGDTTLLLTLEPLMPDEVPARQTR